MYNRLIALLPALAITAVGTTAVASDTMGFRLQLSVPVVCTIEHRAMGVSPVAGPGAVALGSLQEFCNAPQGYRVLVDYTPGALRGAVIVAGNERIMLDGSGQAQLSREAGPRIVNRSLAAIPGSNGFDADRLNFRIVAQ